MALTHWTDADVHYLAGRSVIITGANSGIPRAAARVLARAGASVMLAVRDVEKGEAAVSSMSKTVTVRAGSGGSGLGSHVRSGCARTLRRPHRQAGAMVMPDWRAVDDFEKKFSSDLFGYSTSANPLESIE